jgi:sugar-phosphatase
MILRVRGILFDMDGVLVSSLGSVERSWKTWAESREIDPALAIRTAHGRRAIETVRLLRPDLNDEQELQWLEDMEVADNDGLEILHGVTATDRLARARMAYGGIPVPARMITADMVTKGKPDPEPYRRGAELLDLAPADCLVIEDSASGAKAGHAAGCKVLATLFSHSLESLAIADWIVRSLEDVQVRVVADQVELEFEPVSREAIATSAAAH